MFVLRNSMGVIYPADRCTWTSTYDDDSRQYEIAAAMFYRGNDDGIAIPNTPVQLGVIGKSGRFVPISE